MSRVSQVTSGLTVIKLPSEQVVVVCKNSRSPYQEKKTGASIVKALMTWRQILVTFLTF